MKSRVTVLTSKWSKPFLMLAVLALLSTALGGPARDPVSGYGTSNAINDNQFAGTVTLVVRGEEKSAQLLVTLLAPPRTSNDGVLHVVATHTFTFADGSFTTSDKEVAEPTETPGLYALNATMQVVSGTGVYEGVTGHLTAHGTMDFLAGPTAEFELRGSISHVE